MDERQGHMNGLTDEVPRSKPPHNEVNEPGTQGSVSNLNPVPNYLKTRLYKWRNRAHQMTMIHLPQVP